MITIGERIKKLRVKKGMSQSIMAKKLDCARSAISQWEGGKRKVNVNLLLDIAKVLGVKVSTLVRGLEE